MNPYSDALRKRPVPQTEPLPGREEEMHRNEAGGYVFTIGPLERFKRFLILGTEGGTYYVGQRKLTEENLGAVKALFASELAYDAVDLLKHVSIGGLAHKVSPALVALAVAISSPVDSVRKQARVIFLDVVRTHSHLLEFVSYMDNMRGWGKLARKTVANWYESKNSKFLEYQLLKYQNRFGWTTKDVLRSCHAGATSPTHAALYNYVTDKQYDPNLVHMVRAYEAVHNLEGKEQVDIALWCIEEYGLTREMLPTETLNNRKVWRALLEKMPATAMIRNLGKMASIGLTNPMSDEEELIGQRLDDHEYLRKSRVHPMAVLIANTTYTAGKGVKGSLVWAANQRIVKAMDNAFYATFKNVEPTGKRLYLGIDISSSMGCFNIANTHLTAATGAAAMALVTAEVEPRCYIAGFSTGMVDLGIAPGMPLSEVCRRIKHRTFGGTDCAVMIKDALKQRMPIDAFVVYTDNETWAGQAHTVAILKEYRQRMNLPNTKLIVVAMTPTGSSIGDSADPLSLDVVGFDASTPAAISAFIKD